MKKTKIDRPVNLNLLTEELFSTFPEWTYSDTLPDPLMPGVPLTDVSITEEEIMYPEGTDESAVLAVLHAHNPNGKSYHEREREKKDKDKEDRIKKRNALKAKIRDAADLDDLRAALSDVLDFVE